MLIDRPPQSVVQDAVARALTEDRAEQDVTTRATVGADLKGTARLIFRSSGVAAGLYVAEAAFAALDPGVRFVAVKEDGDEVGPAEVVATIEGQVRALLQAERVGLNFLQRLSGIATLTRRFVEAVEGTGTIVLDTRKTTPGLRELEKYAVRCGGGRNHRGDLESMALIKDNHREALRRAGETIGDGVAAIRRLRPGITVEVEIDSLAELEAALAAQPEWILLDNMPIEAMRAAVKDVAGRARLEASGGVTLETVRRIAETGVDAVSVGALTHSAKALDISLDLVF